MPRLLTLSSSRTTGVRLVGLGAGQEGMNRTEGGGQEGMNRTEGEGGTGQREGDKRTGQREREEQDRGRGTRGQDRGRGTRGDEQDRGRGTRGEEQDRGRGTRGGEQDRGRGTRREGGKIHIHVCILSQSNYHPCVPHRSGFLATLSSLTSPPTNIRLTPGFRSSPVRWSTSRIDRLILDPVMDRTFTFTRWPRLTTSETSFTRPSLLSWER